MSRQNLNEARKEGRVLAKESQRDRQFVGDREDFHGIVLSLERIVRDGRQLIKGGSVQPNIRQLQLQIGIKQLHDMHQSEYLLKLSVVSALSTITLKRSASDLEALQQLLVDQPNIPKEEFNLYLT